MSKAYKLPRCWIGQQYMQDGEFHTVTAEEIDPACTCVNPLQAFWCMEGHLSECHKGMNCAEADCSHMEQYSDNENLEEDCS